jgi:hypothetical protein
MAGGRAVERSPLKRLCGQLRGSWRDGYLLLQFLVSRLVGCMIISSVTASRVLAALLPGWVGDVIRHAYKFGGWFSADSARCSLGRFSHWWRSVWVSVFGERGVHTSVALASTVLLGCQKHQSCTLGQLTSPRFESAFFASFLCRFGQRNDAPPRAVANSDKENIQLMQTTNAESTNPAPPPTTNPKPSQLNIDQ